MHHSVIAVAGEAFVASKSPISNAAAIISGSLLRGLIMSEFRTHWLPRHPIVIISSNRMLELMGSQHVRNLQRAGADQSRPPISSAKPSHDAEERHRRALAPADLYPQERASLMTDTLVFTDKATRRQRNDNRARL
jgi:hypothetical protein